MIIQAVSRLETQGSSWGDGSLSLPLAAQNSAKADGAAFTLACRWVDEAERVDGTKPPRKVISEGNFERASDVPAALPSMKVTNVADMVISSAIS